MLRELITKPLETGIALIELPLTMRRSLQQANELMETSREQLEAMRRQTDEALEQAERMNELLGRVVRLTEPLAMAQRGGEFVGEQLKRVLFGDEREPGLEQTAERVQRALERARAAGEPLAVEPGRPE